MSSPITRRRFLALGAVTALAAPVLAACGAPSGAPPSAPGAGSAPAAPPKAPAAGDTAKPAATTGSAPAAQPAASSGQITLRFMRFAGAGWEHDIKFTDQFMKENPNIAVKGEDTVYGEVFKKCLALGATGTLADVYAGHNRWMPYLGYKGLAMELDPLVKTYAKETQFDDFFPSVIDDIRGVGSEGKLMWFPTVVHPAGNAIIMFNMSLMEKAGLKVPTKDWNIKDFEALVRKAADPKNGIFGTDISMIAPLYAAQFTRSWGKDPEKGSDDAWLISRDGKKFQLESPPVKEAFEWYHKLIKDGLVPTQAEKSALASTGVDHFVAGKMATIAGTVGAPATNRQKIAGRFEMQAVLWPKGPNGHRGSALSFNTQAVYSKTKYPDEAYKFMNYITGPEPAFFSGYEGTLHCMARHSAWFNPKLWERYPVMKDAAEWFQSGVDEYPHLWNVRDQELQDTFGQEFAAYLDGKEDWDAMFAHTKKKCQEIVDLPRP